MEYVEAVASLLDDIRKSGETIEKNADSAHNTLDSFDKLFQQYKNIKIGLDVKLVPHIYDPNWLKIMSGPLSLGYMEVRPVYNEPDNLSILLNIDRKIRTFKIKRANFHKFVDLLFEELCLKRT